MSIGRLLPLVATGVCLAALVTPDAKAQRVPPSCVADAECTVADARRAEAELDGLFERRLREARTADTIPATEREPWQREIAESRRHFHAYMNAECRTLAFEYWGGQGSARREASCRVQMMHAHLRPPGGSALHPCADRPSQVDIGQCLNGELKRSEAELGRLEERRMVDFQSATIPAEHRATWKGLIEAGARAFNAFVEAECGTLAYEYWGGSGAGLRETECRIEAVRMRLGILRQRPWAMR